MLRPAKIIAIVAVVLVATFLRAAAANARLPENLARKASASASSEHNAHYLAKFAIDGEICGRQQRDGPGRRLVRAQGEIG